MAFSVRPLFFAALAFIGLASFAHADVDRDMQEMQRPLNKAGRYIDRNVNDLTNKAEDYAGYGDEAKDSFMCSDPAFFVIQQEHGVTEEQTWILKGVFHVPMAGYAYHFKILGMRSPQAYVQLEVGQPITPQYAQRPAQGPLQVNEKFKLPPSIALLHVRVKGASLNAQEITCDLTSVKETPKGE